MSGNVCGCVGRRFADVKCGDLIDHLDQVIGIHAVILWGCV
jgi:hypothetical protein